MRTWDIYVYIDNGGFRIFLVYQDSIWLKECCQFMG